MQGSIWDNKKKRIAVFANGWSAEYLSQVLEGIKKKAAEDGVDVFVYTTFILPNEDESQQESQLKLFDLMKPDDYDAVIIFAHTFNTDRELKRIANIFRGCDIPMITTEVKVPGMVMVGTGNYGGIYDLSKHLIEVHGAKKIVYVRGNDGNVECAERRKALEDALAEHGLKIEDTIKGDFGFYQASYMLNIWLDEGHALPDAFVCANDLMALGVISRLHNRGIRVPEDVLVTGFDHVHEAQTSYPLVATVSRQWDMMGEYVYEEIKEQFAHPDREAERIYPSKFVPSESCGCQPDHDALKVRLERVRNIYALSTETDMVDFFFQRVHIEMSKVEDRSSFYKYAKEQWGHEEFFGKDYCICVDPLLFEEEDEEYLKRVTRFNERMDVIYERREGTSISPREFDTKEVYPGYVQEPGKSNIYVFSALANLDHLIGYLAVKNTPSILYSLQFKRWINNLDTLFINIRHNIFLKRMNEKLREIYMTDFLTDMYNRTGCENVLYSFIEHQKAAGKKSILLFYDINCMKLINDGYGHLNGDLAIKATTTAMRKSLPKDFLFGRYGGDEFIAVGRASNDKDIEGYREDFDKALKKIVDRLKVPFKLSASVGMCVITPDRKGNIDDFIKEADDSMYEEKQRAHREMGDI